MSRHAFNSKSGDQWVIAKMLESVLFGLSLLTEKQIGQVHCPYIEATHEINVLISVFRWIQVHIWQKDCLFFLNI